MKCCCLSLADRAVRNLSPSTPRKYPGRVRFHLPGMRRNIPGSNTTDAFKVPPLDSWFPVQVTSVDFNSTTTTATLIVPSVSGSVTASVLVNSWMYATQVLTFSDGVHAFTATVTSVGVGTVTVTCNYISAGAAGNTLANGATVKAVVPSYEFVEVMLQGFPPIYVSKPGGRFATSANPGYAIVGSFSVGGYAMARSAPGAGGTLWEMTPLVGGGGIASSGFYARLVARSGTAWTWNALSCDGSGNVIDAGTVSPTPSAVPVGPDPAGSVMMNPGDRVWLIPLASGFYGFVPKYVFPAVITSTWSGTTGYNWTRNATDTSTMLCGAQSPSVSGQYAIEVSNNQTVPVGTGVLMQSAAAGAGTNAGYEFEFPTQGSPPSGPSAPTSVSVNSETANTASVVWTAPGGSPAAANYLVMQSTSASMVGQVVAGVTSGTSFTLTGLTTGTAYYSTVIPLTSGGVPGTASSIVGTAPNAPTGLTPTAGNAQVALTWVAPSTSNGNAAAATYNVSYSTHSDMSSPTLFANTASTSSTVTGLTNGTLYYFQVVAVSTQGALGPGSSIVNTTPHTPGSYSKTAAGTYTFTASFTGPHTVQLWGGGSGGTQNGGDGGGGGGGAYASSVVNLTNGNNYTVIVGAGTIADGGSAGDSSFNAGAVLAKGSGAPSGTTGATGGQSGSCVGTTVFSGGNGGNGNVSGGGGGGGSSAGTAAIGANGTNGTATGGAGGTAPSGGGNGGTGGTNGVANATNGSNPGGGGGGGGPGAGNGKDGQALITW
jgi:hypothetical protein